MICIEARTLLQSGTVEVGQAVPGVLNLCGFYRKMVLENWVGFVPLCSFGSDLSWRWVICEGARDASRRRREIVDQSCAEVGAVLPAQPRWLEGEMSGGESPGQATEEREFCLAKEPRPVEGTCQTTSGGIAPIAAIEPRTSRTK